MAESKEIFTEVATMRDELDEQGAVLDALVRASSAKKDLLDVLRKDPTATSILLAVDGVRSQNDIVLATDTSKATVSKKLARLSELGLVAISHKQGQHKVYHRTRLDRALRLSAELEREARRARDNAKPSSSRKKAT